MSVELGEVIDGKYRIERLLGEGGMGAVFEAENVRIRRRVAIKLLHPAVAEMGAAVQRFEREAQAAGQIGNDHILEVLDLGILPDGSRYIAMEYLDGEPLSARIEAQGKIPARPLADLMLQALEGLAAAHRAGIVHRDLKPDNIYILKEKAGRRDFIKLIDFGISKFQKGGPEGMQMTHTGAVLGTPYYMSPEQAAGSQTVNATTDLYALGVILYEAATGRRPFESDSFQQLLFQIVLGEPPHPKTLSPELDDGFVTIILKAMSRDPEHRFQSADEFIGALNEWIASGKSVHVAPKSHINPALAGIVAPTLLQENSPVAGVTAGNDTSAASTWAQSQSFAPPTQKKAVLPFVLGGGALVALLGVVAVVVIARGGSKPAAAAVDAPEAAESAAQAANPEVPPVPEVPTVVADTTSVPAAPTNVALPTPPPIPQLPTLPKTGQGVAPPSVSVAAAPPPASTPTPAPVAEAPPPPPTPPPPPVAPKPPKPPPKPQGNDFGY